LPKKLVLRMQAREYIDFTELPPAKGKARPVPQAAEGQVVVVQAADLMQARKITPHFRNMVPVLLLVCGRYCQA